MQVKRLVLASLALVGSSLSLKGSSEPEEAPVTPCVAGSDDPWADKANYLEVHADRRPVEPPTYAADTIELALDQGHPERVDRFRQSLPPDQRAHYDQELAELENDPRICFHYHPGASPEQGYADLALRGFLAGSWGLDPMREDALDRAVHEHGGHLDVTLTPAPDLDFDPDNPYVTLGLTNQDGDMLLSQPAIVSSIARGANVASHEFIHTMQANGKFFCDLPVGSEPDFQARFEAAFLRDYEPKKPDDTVHYLTRVGEDFRYYPETLKEKSPDLYGMMVEYTGYDPLAGGWLVASPPGNISRLSATPS